MSVDAPLETIPVLVKAGSILPMEDYQQLTLHLYPPTQRTCEVSSKQFYIPDENHSEPLTPEEAYLSLKEMVEQAAATRDDER